MEPSKQQTDLDEQLKERFLQLPKVVQDAITSADVEKHLRGLADTHKLHLDQWEKLENEVMLSLLGIQTIEDLEKNIRSEVGVDAATAAALAKDISQGVFEPIRQELERQLEHPDAQAAEVSGVDAARNQILRDEKTPSVPAAAAAPTTPTAPVVPAVPVAPATPPPAAPTTKVERAPVSPVYAPKVASHERKTIEGDPYREQL